YDLHTLQPLPVKTPRGIPQTGSPVSADGTVFGAWGNTSITTFILEGEELARYEEGGAGHVVPGPDGRVVYTAGGVRSSQLKPVAGTDPEAGYCLPAVEGPYFLSLTSADPGAVGGLKVYLLGSPRPLFRDPNFG